VLVFNGGSQRVFDHITFGPSAAALTLLLATVVIPVASAQDIPTDAELNDAETAAVQPVLVVGASPEAAWGQVSGFLASKHERTSAVPVVSMPNLADEGGFGFAGKARAADMRILAHAVLLGRYAGMVAQGGTSRDVQSKLAETADAVYAPLAPRVKSALAALITGLGTGRFDPALFAATLRMAEGGIATGPQRAHGYLAIGLWAGLSPMVAGIAGDRSIYAGMAGPLAILLREDAEFEGADVQIAKTIETMAVSLATKTPDHTGLAASADSLFQVKSDK
jgi:hypothetical protein